MVGCIRMFVQCFGYPLFNHYNLQFINIFRVLFLLYKAFIPSFHRIKYPKYTKYSMSRLFKPIYLEVVAVRLGIPQNHT